VPFYSVFSKRRKKSSLGEPLIPPARKEKPMHELLFFIIGLLLGGIIALLAMCLVQMIRSSDTQISRRDGDDK